MKQALGAMEQVQVPTRTHLPPMAQNRLKLARTFHSLISGHTTHPFRLTSDKKSPAFKTREHRREKLNALYFE